MTSSRIGFVEYRADTQSSGHRVGRKPVLAGPDGPGKARVRPGLDLKEQNVFFLLIKNIVLLREETNDTKKHDFHPTGTFEVRKPGAEGACQNKMAFLNGPVLGKGKKNVEEKTKKHLLRKETNNA